MRIHPARRAALIGAAITLMTGTLLAAAPVQAAPVQPDPATIAATMAERLGARSAGTYLDRASGRAVVTVTNAADARTVSSAGGVAKVVARSGADLQQARDTLYRTARVPGTAWAVDPASNQVLVSVDETVTGAKFAKVQAAVDRLGDAARIERVAGTFRSFITGGDPIFAGGGRCSLGFNVQNSAGTFFFLTAGHCTDFAATWTDSSGTVLGSRVASSFPGNDYGVVQYNASYTNHPGTVGSVDITSARNAVVGESVQRRGSTTGTHGGTVNGVNTTVVYPEGAVGGMIRTNVCAEPGDSGGPLYSGGAALGLTSGGNGNCSVGGTTFFQPVTEPLNLFGLSVF